MDLRSWRREVREIVESGGYERRTFSLLAVPGSIMFRTSFTSWLTLDPTSPAPMRMTMLLGALLADVLALTLPADPLLAPTCVRFLVRLRAI